MKGDIYHTVNRGVEKRKIFVNDKDFLRFLHNLNDFNDKNVAPMSYHDRRSFNLAIRKPSDELVDIICVCLMPNHYHLLVQEKVDGGAGLFSKKVSSGYTQYFNLINGRSGFLFQGKTKIIPVKNDEHFLHLPYYIFSNPIKLIDSRWKENGIKDSRKVAEFLKNYRWSSFIKTILGEENLFCGIVNDNLFFKLFDTNPKQFERDFFEWLKERD